MVGPDAPKFMYPVVPSNDTAVFEPEGAFVTREAPPMSCAGPGETCALGASPVITSTLLVSNVHSRIGSSIFMFRVPPRTEEAFMVVTLVVERLEAPVTFMVPPRAEEVLRVVALVVERFEVPVTFRALIPKIEEAFRVVKLVVERFEVPVTFRVPPRTEEVLRVVTLVVERFEVPVTFRDVPKIEEAFMVVRLVVDRFEIPNCAGAPTFKFVPKIEDEVRDVTLMVVRFEVPVTFVSVENRLEAFITRAFPLV